MRLKIKPKLILSYVCVVLIPIGIIGGILTTAIEKRDVNQNIASANHHLEYVMLRIQEILNVGTKASTNLYGNKKLESILTHQYTYARDIVRDYRGYNTIHDLKTLYKEIGTIQILTTNSTLLNNSEIIPVTDEMKYHWYTKALTKRGKAFWEYIYNSEKNVYELSNIRCLSNYKDTDFSVNAVLIVTINGDSISEFLKSEKYNTVLLNSQGYILASSIPTQVGNTLKEIGIAPKGQRHGEKTVMNNDSECYLVNKTVLLEDNETSITVSSIVPKADVAYAAKLAKFAYVLITLGVTAAAMILIFLFAEVWSKRIKKLNDSMHLIASGNLDLQVELNGTDEISQLADSMNFMVKEIKTMTIGIHDANLQKQELLLKQKDMQFKFLASQINPHYLFNVLESVRMKALVNEQKEIALVIKLIGNQLRTSMSMESGEISIREELQFITNYVQIQTFRFGDKFELCIDIQEEQLYDYKILPLIIQPLVENAVIHGMEEKELGGVIKITIGQNENGVFIRVSDNGIGMTQDKIDQLNDGLGTSTNKGRIGLLNIDQRVKLHWGNQYGLMITSADGSGTTVTIRLPQGDV